MADIRTYNLREAMQNACVKDEYTAIGALSIDNGCCHDKLVLIIRNKCEISEFRPKGFTYACQCACGKWRTSDYSELGNAIEAYMGLTNIHRQACEFPD